jgi:hypothetical protein
MPLHWGATQVTARLFERSSREASCEVRILGSVFAIGLLSILAGSCGGANPGSGSKFRPSHTTTIYGAAANDLVTTVNGCITPRGGLGAGASSGSDPSLDVRVEPRDRRIYAFCGHPAGRSDRRAVIAVVKRYYSTAAADNGKGACLMMAPGLVKSLPMEYGRFGAPYLRGAKTCRTVLSRFFRHHHRELIVPIMVSRVFIKGDRAFAPVDSPMMPPSIIVLRHEYGAWAIEEPLGGRILGG